MSITAIVMTIVVLTVLVFFWFGMHYYLHPRMDNADARAVVTGPCGDTMEIYLKFNGPRVEKVRCWTSGCSISRMCIETAAGLARGKTVAELQQIDIAAIMEKTGKLPETHLHCARLAEITLLKAVSDYSDKTPSA